MAFKLAVSSLPDGFSFWDAHCCEPSGVPPRNLGCGGTGGSARTEQPRLSVIGGSTGRALLPMRMLVELARYWPNLADAKRSRWVKCRLERRSYDYPNPSFTDLRRLGWRTPTR